MKNILFVCTGNTCRSSMAEALFKDMLEKLDEEMDEIKVHSAGIYATQNLSASAHAIDVMRNRGIDLSKHKSRLLTEKMIDEADLILTMTLRHKQGILNIAPEAENKVFTLKEYVAEENEHILDIIDPFGQSVEVYEKTAEEIKQALKTVMDEMVKK